MSRVDPLWYRDAVIYELHVRSFCDGNDDGYGDFVGLRSKLPYLQELGVNTLWLLPFYESPLKDDGYDIADYTQILPVYGTPDDFQAVLDDAHARDMRVITELVLNHTSDRHPWFLEARQPGSCGCLRTRSAWCSRTRSGCAHSRSCTSAASARSPEA